MNNELLTINIELRTTNYQLNTSDERQATRDEFALFWSFYVVFCAFCASLRLIKHLFSQLLYKAIVMALCTKAITCDKAGFKSRFCQEHQAGKNIISLNPVILPALEFRRRGSNFSSFLCAFCAFLWLKNPRNLRNLRLIKDLRHCKALYNCRETFTNVMSALQIRLFLQNKANFQKVKLNVNKVLTKNYEQMDTWSIRKKQSQTKPNKPKFKKAKMNVTSYITKGYENKSNWAICENEPNSNPISSKRFKTNWIVRAFDGCYNAVLCRQDEVLRKDG